MPSIWTMLFESRNSVYKSVGAVCYLITQLALVSAYAEQPEILQNPVNVTSVSSQRLDNGQQEFRLRISVAPDHFVYADSLSIKSTLGDKINATFEVEAFPVIEFLDKFSNNEIKQGVKDSAEMTFKVPYNFDFNSTFALTYRACTSEFCYLPKTRDFEHGIEPVANKSSILNMSIDFHNSSLFLIFLFVFLAGVLTSFTPCIFPMIPITLALIGQDIINNRFLAFRKTCIYVLGIATTYSILGLIAASTGSLFGQLLSNPWVLIGIGIFYFVMAASLAGLFEIQFLSSLQNKMQQPSLKSVGGIYLFGAFTGLFASPCVGPVLIGILTYAAQSKNLIFAFFLLFIYALGLGQIFIAMSLSGSLINKLPKAGGWMNYVKYLLAVLLVGAGLFFMVPGVKSLWHSFTSTGGSAQAMLDEALAKGRPVVVDLKADWCAACIEMEKVTFPHPDVQTALEGFEFLAIDVTHLDTEKSAILKKYKVLGLPTILIFDSKGHWLEQLTVTQFMGPKEMLQLLGKVESESTSIKIPQKSEEERQ
ncbi:MAG: thioredoxin family protein [Bdellovibrionaceae bacterium]|nr:thioredoxin family protein [Pseudobdellovibrionaceae bacterium]